MIHNERILLAGAGGTDIDLVTYLRKRKLSLTHHPYDETHGSWREYLADGVVHVAGVILAVIGAAFVVYWAATHSDNIFFVALIAYGMGLIGTFIFSAAYNLTTQIERRAFLRKLDRAAIFIMIAGTYTPLGLIGIGGSWGYWIVVAVWVIAAIGASYTLFWPRKIERLSMALYLGQSWLIILAIKPMFESMSLFASTMVIVGGLVYMAGVLFYHRDDWPYNRAIWHTFVLSAAAIHFFAILDVAQAG